MYVRRVFLSTEDRTGKTNDKELGKLLYCNAWQVGTGSRVSSRHRKI